MIDLEILNVASLVVARPLANLIVLNDNFSSCGGSIEESSEPLSPHFGGSMYGSLEGIRGGMS